MLRFAIVEDDPATQKTISDCVYRFASENGETCSIAIFSDGDEILDEYKAAYDIILLDIEMARLDGLKTAELIRRLDEDVVIIFVTNLINFAVHGYAVNALDFVVKPVSYASFSPQLKKAAALVSRRRRRYIAIPTGVGLLRLDASKITYIESFNHKLVIHTTDEDYSLSGTMRNMEALFGDHGFARCNNSYLVNLNAVERVDHNLVTVGGQELVISRPKKKTFMDALTKFIGGGLT